ncbi:MAG: hypothetical protein HOA53_16890 [Anaerolineae bacterium]|nr:hypothetical protein [Anaerolineae bacterium]
MIDSELYQSWLNALPMLLRKYAQRWRLEILVPFENLSYNYAAPVRCTNSTSAVIKIAFPNDEARVEIAALRHFDGRSMGRLHKYNRADCVFLLERVIPGGSLWKTDDEQATNIFLDLMPKLWHPYLGDYHFSRVEDWGKGFSRFKKRYVGGTGILDRKLVDKAERVFDELLASSDDAVLLHGDLHHGNVLSAERQSYLAIDPKGVLGEQCYEVGAFLRNPIPDLLKKENPRAMMMRRVDQIVERLGFDRQRVIGWGMSQAVLAAIWCIEDNASYKEELMGCAEILYSL